eukprot:TRINITY_DN1948_c0_g4_i1.p1 TRINITY_DN1948_c0_g4~~TRINITY_DN1948_c0_g4_i1.p1  ORF type:complete len:622 (+),score=164.25 TRINITY_DN1948_c0_g4_i1:237-1868(+)
MAAPGAPGGAPPQQAPTQWTAEPMEALRQIYDGLRREPLVHRPVDDTHGFPMQNTQAAYFSIFDKAMETRAHPPTEPNVSESAWAMIDKVAREDAACGAAIASLIGLSIGDAVGHPFEFIAVDATLPAEDGSYPPYRPHLRPELLEGADGSKHLDFRDEENKFELKRGQWTDDCSMALCLADSLLVHKGYHGGDARLRWHQWWNYGYCNAFRHDDPHVYDGEDGKEILICKRPSIGLGGNIAMSIIEVNDLPPHRREVDTIPPIYSSHNEDAGNGSIMRLAPVPICFHDNMEAALQVAEYQSRATHPGPDAVACCKFMTYLMIKAFECHKSGDDIGKSGDAMREFVDTTIKGFISETEGDDDTGIVKLHAVISSKPPSDREINWDWKVDEMCIRGAVRERRASEDGRYNGYPVIPTYWGAYCMDGLAMALWALYHSNSFSECIIKVVNLLGDADTTGAIAAQMAGAIYGWKGIADSDMGQVFLRDLRQWDPYCEIGVRAACLYHFRPEATLAQKINFGDAHPGGEDEAEEAEEAPAGFHEPAH